MERYVGMDVSLKETSICVVDDDGEIQCEGTVISEPSTIAEFIKAKAGSAKRIGLETGPMTTWLWHGLRALALPVICIGARHAKAALSLQINKSDRNGAVGLARIMRCGCGLHGHCVDTSALRAEADVEIEGLLSARERTFSRQAQKVRL